MNISQIINVNNIQNIKTAKTVHSYMSKGLMKDTFERSTPSFKGNFNLDSAMKELKEMKGLKNTPKFNDERLDIISKELTKSPEKWEPFKALIQNPKILGSIACEIIVKDAKDVEAISELACKKKPNDCPRFTPFDIKYLATNLKGSNFDKAKVLADCNLGIDDVIALSKNPKISNFEKITDSVNKMEADCGENLLSMSFKTDEYDNNGFSLTADLRNSGKKVELYDKDLKKISKEEVEPQTTVQGRQYQIKKTIDYRTNIVSKVRLEVSKKLPQPVLINEIRVVKDKNGNVLRKEYTDQSDVAGVLNIKHVFPDGSEKVLSKASFNPKTGITTVKKDMTSLDGTRTQYLYENDEKGNRISDYKITDKNGKVLLNNSQAFEVISDNKFISSKNNDKYEITVNDKELNVKQLNGNKKATLNFETYINGEKGKIIEVLKQIPGEELVNMSESVKYINGIDDILNINSTYGAVNKRIKTSNNLYVMLHELGHAKDYEKVDVENTETLEKSIFSNPKINAVFAEEKALFNKKFPNAQREHISYFIKTSEHKDELQETIAETNALLNTHNSFDLFSIRSQYLQQYFPKTIAALSEALK